MTKMRSTHPPSKPLERKQGSPHCFFGLPPPDDNPTAFVDIKANFFQHTKVNKSRLFGAIAHDLSVIVVDRSFQIGVISFDIDRFKSASLLSIMPRRLSISLLSGISNPEAIANKSVPNTARNLPPETSLLGFVDV